MNTPKTLILLSFFLFFGLFSIAQQPLLPIIFNQKTDSTYVYESKLTFKKNTFGGLLLAKKMQDNTLQVVLTSKFGMKVFDFTLSADSLHANYAVEALNKNIVKKMFYKDLKMIYPFLYKTPKVKHKKQKIVVKEKCKRYKYALANNETTQIRKGISTNKVEINRQNNKISSLLIIHSLIDLKIEVKPLTFAE
ncbi:MAG: hypothetical protein R2777_09665 [Chitinophagales bacterium]|nr:hypothetical protein [Bacteroidota bacterium]MCB9225778.1 hypothetical protein [Chitinophagales bacterium]